MLVLILLAIAVVLAIIVGIAATRPDTFEVTRTEAMHAPPEAVYPLVVDFRQWGRWSPWEQLDPDMERRHSGAPAGVGAVYEWSGNKKAGEGRMEITEAEAPHRVVIALDFIKPFAASNVTAFQIERDGAGSVVTWSMHGPNSFAGKLFSVFVNMEKMIGRDYERGLAALRLAAEHEAAGSPV
jgi:uncharacterized protein YndB with AHSA1/START domain